MSLLSVFTRTVGAFIVLFILAKLMGKKQISELTFFNYVTGISIGAIAGAISIESTLKVSAGILSLCTWGALTLLVAFIDLKSRKARKILEGEPVIVIKQGKVMEQVLKKQRLDMDKLLLLLRKKDVFSIQDVEYAIFETNGELSVLLKEEKQPLIQENIPFQLKKQKKTPISIQIIADGKLIEENLQQLNLSTNWVEETLGQSGTSLDDVFYAELQEDGTLYVDKRNDQFLH